MTASHKTLLYLVRHGATVSNERRPYVLQGSNVDNPLSETGMIQAQSVAELLARVSLSAIYCSRMTRAVQTADAIAAKHAFEPTTLDSIHEVDVGQWEGLSWIDIEALHREHYEAFIASPGTVAYLGGESYANVLSRAEPIFRSLFRQHAGQSFAVVAHNVVNRAYLSHLLGLDINLAKNVQQTNTCVNVIEWDHERERGSVLTLNSNFHVPGVLN